MVKQFDISVDIVPAIKCMLNVTVVVGKRAKNLVRNVGKYYQKLPGICCVLLFTECIRGWVGFGSPPWWQNNFGTY